MSVRLLLNINLNPINRHMSTGFQHNKFTQKLSLNVTTEILFAAFSCKAVFTEVQSILARINREVQETLREKTNRFF